MVYYYSIHAIKINFESKRTDGLSLVSTEKIQIRGVAFK